MYYIVYIHLIHGNSTVLDNIALVSKSEERNRASVLRTLYGSPHVPSLTPFPPPPSFTRLLLSNKNPCDLICLAGAVLFSLPG